MRSFFAMFAAVLAGCGLLERAPGQPVAETEPRPDKVASFAMLYGTNCAGCHGADGGGMAAQALSDPNYLAIADDATIRRVVREGIRWTPMPAFARSAGGMLTNEQIEVIVVGMRSRWSRAEATQGIAFPPYATREPGDAVHGAAAYSTFCSACHGADGRGGQKGSSIVDGSYLALVSDQSLRTTVIVGRPELGAPDFRGNVPGRPMSAQDVNDVVAWLSTQRPAVAGQPYPAAVRTAAGDRP